jgi:hypothetical protein
LAAEESLHACHSEPATFLNACHSESRLVGTKNLCSCLLRLTRLGYTCSVSLCEPTAECVKMPHSHARPPSLPHSSNPLKTHGKTVSLAQNTAKKRNAWSKWKWSPPAGNCRSEPKLGLMCFPTTYLPSPAAPRTSARARSGSIPIASP